MVGYFAVKPHDGLSCPNVDNRITSTILSLFKIPSGAKCHRDSHDPLCDSPQKPGYRSFDCSLVNEPLEDPAVLRKEGSVGPAAREPLANRWRLFYFMGSRVVGVVAGSCPGGSKRVRANVRVYLERSALLFILSPPQSCSLNQNKLAIAVWILYLARGWNFEEAHHANTDITHP